MNLLYPRTSLFLVRCVLAGNVRRRGQYGWTTKRDAVGSLEGWRR